MSRKFRIDEIRFYVWALKEFGYDVRDFAEGFQEYPQANLSTIESVLRSEIKEDAQHQLNNWLYVDRAIEAIGMLEADGYTLGDQGRLVKDSYEKIRGKTNDVFISLLQPNLNVYIGQLRGATSTFEAVPNQAVQDAKLFGAFNAYNREILNQNGFEQQNELVMRDGAAYGSGVWYQHYDPLAADPDDTFFEERARSGDPIDFEDYMRLQKLTKAHQIEYVNTFEVIGCRYMAGPSSWDLDTHPYTTRCRQVRLAEAMRDFPDYADKMRPAMAQEYRDTNPYSYMYQRDTQDTITRFDVEIRFPLSYSYEVPIRLANGEIVYHNHPHKRDMICHVTMFEGVGIVDMKVDQFAHHAKTLTQWVNYPSSKHSRGIGLCKYGYAPQRVHSIMFNGKLRFFKRMIKGGGFFFKGVIDREDIEAQTAEHAWIGIDPAKLPADLAARPIGELIHSNPPPQFPNAYDQMESNAFNYVNLTMSAPPPSKGFRSGNSGRQELALMSQTEMVMNSGSKAFEAAMLPLGRKQHSNIIQFDGATPNITFFKQNPLGQWDEIVLNEVVDTYLIGDGVWKEWQAVPYLIRNNIMTLRYSTQLTTHSLLPNNPTELRLFYSDLLTKITPYIQSGPGLVMLKYLDAYGFGGLPGFQQMIDEMRQELAREQQIMMQQNQAKLQQDAQQQQFDNYAKLNELAQNKYRLDTNRASDTTKQAIQLVEAMIKAQQEGVQPDKLLSQAKSMIPGAGQPAAQ